MTHLSILEWDRVAGQEGGSPGARPMSCWLRRARTRLAALRGPIS